MVVMHTKAICLANRYRMLPDLRAPIYRNDRQKTVPGESNAGLQCRTELRGQRLFQQPMQRCKLRLAHIPLDNVAFLVDHESGWR